MLVHTDGDGVGCGVGNAKAATVAATATATAIAPARQAAPSGVGRAWKECRKSVNKALSSAKNEASCEEFNHTHTPLTTDRQAMSGDGIG